jgi:hypothetical protein
MSHDDYAKRQSQRDAEYELQYKAWIATLSAKERKELEKSGLDTPMVARNGNGAADHDMADSPLASHTPAIAALVDHEEQQPETHSMGSATEILRRLVADIIYEDNTRLTIDCLSIALGMRVYEGDSMTKIAKRHGISRAAVSKRCVDITERLKLPPSRAMRSENARKTYRNSQIKRYRTEER